jgi:hypothetical protein
MYEFRILPIGEIDPSFLRMNNSGLSYLRHSELPVALSDQLLATRTVRTRRLKRLGIPNFLDPESSAFRASPVLDARRYYFLDFQLMIC